MSAEFFDSVSLIIIPPNTFTLQYYNMPSYCDTYSCMYVKSRFDSLDNSSYRDRLSVVYFRLHNDNNQG